MSLRCLPLLVALCALGGCFTPEYHCRILCNPPGSGEECPTGFKCETDGTQRLCARTDITRSCFAPPAPDAAPDTPAGTEPPAQLCYGSGCFDLSPEARKALVLWLDPSTLPAAETEVARWADRSGKGNDALALSPEGRPRSRGDGIRLQPVAGGSMRIQHSTSLDFEAEDFAMLIVARVAPAPPSCLFAKTNFDRVDPRGVLMEWAYALPQQPMFSPSVNGTTLQTSRAGLGDLTPHLFVLRRSGDAIEARVDGTPAGDVGSLNPPGQSVTNSSHAFLGGCGTTSPTISAVHAVVGLRGAISLAELTRLEGFLLTSFPR
jgi:hypothetical protein